MVKIHLMLYLMNTIFVIHLDVAKCWNVPSKYSVSAWTLKATIDDLDSINMDHTRSGLDTLQKDDKQYQVFQWVTPSTGATYTDK